MTVLNQPIVRSLSNGLKLVLLPCAAESIAFGLFVASGSRHESDREAGISHFIEHMLFKGTPTRRPVDIVRAIEGRGGNFNACTSEESTIFYAHLPREYLADAIAIMSDMYLNATIPEDEFNREKQVVIEEIKMYADDPDSVAMENLQRIQFPNDPLGRPIAGSEKTLLPMKAEDLRRYIARHYRTSNTYAVVVGSFDPDRATDLAEAALGAKRRQKDFARPQIDLSTLPERESVVMREELFQAQLAIGYREPFAHTMKDVFASTVLNGILGQGMASRLFQEVREKRGLSYDIISRVHHFSDAGFFVIAAGVDPFKRLILRDTIDREVEKITKKRVSQAEMNRIKEFLLGNFRLSHERVTSKLFFYGQTFLVHGRLTTPEEQIAEVRAITADDVIEYARKLFREENRSESWVLPKTT